MCFILKKPLLLVGHFLDAISTTLLPMSADMFKSRAVMWSGWLPFHDGDLWKVRGSLWDHQLARIEVESSPYGTGNQTCRLRDYHMRHGWEFDSLERIAFRDVWEPVPDVTE